MLSFLGFLMIFTFLLLILTKRVSPFLGLTVVPIIYGIIGGFGSELGNLMMEGIQNVAPTAIAFVICHFVFW